jgi:prevent-host-death family protein
MVRGARHNMIKIPLSEIKDQFSKVIKKAGKEEVIVTVHGRPAAVIIGFKNEDDWLEYRLLKDERFLARIAEAREQYKQGKYKNLEDLP